VWCNPRARIDLAYDRAASPVLASRRFGHTLNHGLGPTHHGRVSADGLRLGIYLPDFRLLSFWPIKLHRVNSPRSSRLQNEIRQRRRPLRPVPDRSVNVSSPVRPALSKLDHVGMDANRCPIPRAGNALGLGQDADLVISNTRAMAFLTARFWVLLPLIADRLDCRSCSSFSHQRVWARVLVRVNTIEGVTSTAQAKQFRSTRETWLSRSPSIRKPLLVQVDAGFLRAT